MGERVGGVKERDGERERGKRVRGERVEGMKERRG